MTTYEFTLVLKGSIELTEEVADQLFEAGCDDGTPGTCQGAFSISFHREARTLEDAIRSAIAQVQTAGFVVERVEIEAGAIPVSA
jgi:hypothetical protein